MIQLPMLDDEPLGHPNIPAAKFEKHVQRLHANQNGLFAEEYKVSHNLLHNTVCTDMLCV